MKAHTTSTLMTVFNLLAAVASAFVFVATWNFPSKALSPVVNGVFIVGGLFVGLAFSFTLVFVRKARQKVAPTVPEYSDHELASRQHVLAWLGKGRPSQWIVQSKGYVYENNISQADNARILALTMISYALSGKLAYFAPFEREAYWEELARLVTWLTVHRVSASIEHNVYMREWS